MSGAISGVQILHLRQFLTVNHRTMCSQLLDELEALTTHIRVSGPPPPPLTWWLGLTWILTTALVCLLETCHCNHVCKLALVQEVHGRMITMPLLGKYPFPLSSRVSKKRTPVRICTPVYTAPATRATCRQCDFPGCSAGCSYWQDFN